MKPARPPAPMPSIPATATPRAATTGRCSPDPHRGRHGASDHYIYVSDPGLPQRLHLRPPGRYSRASSTGPARAWARRSRAASAEDAAGNIWVAEFNSRRIFVFNPTHAARSSARSPPAERPATTCAGSRHRSGQPPDLRRRRVLNRIYEFSYDPAKVASGTGASQHRRQVRERVAEHGRHQLRLRPPADGLDPVPGGRRPGQRVRRRDLGLRYAAGAPAPRTATAWRSTRPASISAFPSCTAMPHAQTTCAGATRLPWATGPQPPPQGGFNQQNGIAIDPNLEATRAVASSWSTRSSSACRSSTPRPRAHRRPAARPGSRSGARGAGQPRVGRVRLSARTHVRRRHGLGR